MITSTSNERIKAARRLHSSKYRRRAGRLLLEGVRLIEDALQSEAVFECVYYACDLAEQSAEAQRLLQTLRDREIECIAVSTPVFVSLSDTVTPQGWAAVVEIPTHVPIPMDSTLSLVLDGVSDPGNAGTLLRSAEAAGVRLVVFGPGSVDPYNDKVLRSGMGAHFRIPIQPCGDWSEVRAVLDGSSAQFVADASAGLRYDEVDWTAPAVLIVGSEAHGPSAEARAAATPVAIPMQGAVESLNVAVAGSVILFEAARQRARYVQRRR